jgi:hypothetical protein
VTVYLQLRYVLWAAVDSSRQITSAAQTRDRPGSSPAKTPEKDGAEPKPDAKWGTSLVQRDKDQAAFIVRRPTRTASPGQLDSLHRGPRQLMAGSANPLRVYKVEA